MNEIVELALPIPIVVGLTQLVKDLGVPRKWVPVLSLAIGVAAALALSGLSVASVVQGIVYGLSASGLYSSSKAVVQEISKEKSAESAPGPTTTDQPPQP